MGIGRSLEMIVTHSSSFETLEAFFTGRSSHLPETPKEYHVFELPKKGHSLGNTYFAIRPGHREPNRWNSAIFWASPSSANAISEIEKYCKSLPPELEELNRFSSFPYQLFVGGCALLMGVVAVGLTYGAVDLFIKASPETKPILGVGYGILTVLGGLAVWNTVNLIKMDNHRSKDVPEGFRRRVDDGKAIRTAVGYVTGQVR